MFVAHEQKLHRYFFFLQGSHSAGKMNSYLNTPVYSLISPSNIKYENRINQQLSLAAFSHKQKKKTMNSISTSGFLKEFGLIKLA